MTEAEKYEKGLYQPKDKKGNKNQHNVASASESTLKSTEPKDKSAISTTVSAPETPAEPARPSTSTSSAPTENLGKRKRGDDGSTTKANSLKSSKVDTTSVADTETATSTKSPKSKGKQRDSPLKSPPTSPKAEATESAPASADKIDRLLKLVKKHGQSDTGISMHKLLKKYHKKLEVTDEKHGKGRETLKKVLKEQRIVEEESLWKSLRLKTNDRGEIVLTM